MRISQRRRLTLVAIAIVAALSLAAAVEASIPDGGGVIHGCYTPAGGLRVIDTGNGAKCLPAEKAVQWNVQGPTGPQGAQGAQGPAGPKGDPGDPGPTYSAGTGLGLSGTTFGIAGSYQLPQGCSDGQSPFLLGTPLTHPWSCFTAANANESCSSGKFQNGVDGSGDITCATPPSGSSAPDIWVTGNGFVDSPNTPEGAIIASLALPAGAYLLNAKGEAAHDTTSTALSGNDVSVSCELRENGVAIDFTLVDDEADSKNPSVPFTLTGVPSSSSAIAIDLWCRGDEDGQHVSNVVLTATSVGTINQE